MGWGFPCSWQGWVVFLLYISLIIAASWLVPPDKVPTRYGACTLGLTVIFVGICILKGGRQHC